MKKLLLIIIVLFCGCGQSKNNVLPQRKFNLTIHNGHGWSYGSSVLQCDSFQMIGTKKANAYIDGVKMSIEAEDVIYPSTNIPLF